MKPAEVDPELKRAAYVDGERVPSWEAGASHVIDFLAGVFLEAGITVPAWRLEDIARFAYLPPERAMIQDPASRLRLEEVEGAARKLENALRAVSALGGSGSTERLDLCQLFAASAACAGLDQSLSAALREIAALKQRGVVTTRQPGQSKSGTKPNLLFREFVRTLHWAFAEETGRRGYGQRGGRSTDGEFVDLVFKAQAILPEAIRAERKTIATRVFRALVNPTNGTYPQANAPAHPPAGRPRQQTSKRLRK